MLSTSSDSSLGMVQMNLIVAHQQKAPALSSSPDKCCNHEPGPTKELTLPLQPTILNLAKQHIANKT
jgi:hypothetical protein